MKYCVLTFGCRTNQADSFDLERGFRAAGAAPSAPESADVVVVNTCTVTGAADQAARNAIRRIARANPLARIVATGCYATRTPDEVGRIPGVTALVPNSAKQAIPSGAEHGVGAVFGESGAPLQILRKPLRPRAALLVPGSRGRTAYPLRVQTGCDERCAYCIVPRTRGAGRSRPLVDVCSEAGAAAAAGFKELWITGVHLGSYGRDFRPARSLADLLAALAAATAGTDITFRLSSVEPMDCGQDVLDALSASPRFLPHLHLPLQHASGRILSAMRRPYTFDRFQQAVDAVRDRFPDAAIGTDVIAGFPGEDDDDYGQLVDYLRRSPLTHVHAFGYSDRPGTEASSMAGKVPAGEIQRRVAGLRAVADSLNGRFVARQLGRERAALTLHDGTVALTDNYLKLRIPPGRVRNERVSVRIVAAQPLRGEVVGAAGG